MESHSANLTFLVPFLHPIEKQINEENSQTETFPGKFQKKKVLENVRAR